MYTHITLRWVSTNSPFVRVCVCVCVTQDILLLHSLTSNCFKAVSRKSLSGNWSSGTGMFSNVSPLSNMRVMASCSPPPLKWTSEAILIGLLHPVYLIPNAVSSIAISERHAHYPAFLISILDIRSGLHNRGRGYQSHNLIDYIPHPAPPSSCK